MAETKYSKYIIREPLAFNTFPPLTPRLLFDSKNFSKDELLEVAGAVTTNAGSSPAVIFIV
jgi:hypothetical protein